MKRFHLVLAGFCLYSVALSAQSSLPVAGTAAASSLPASSAIATIRRRYILSVLPTDPEQIDRLKALSTSYANSLQPDGNWPDINYQKNGRATWTVVDHLNRTLVMAKAARLDRNSGHPNGLLESKVIRALKAWTDRDYQDPNWWWNQIGVPELIGEIATLMRPEVPQSELAKVIEIMKRSDWRRVPWTGANLTWGVVIEIVRGCLEDNSATVTEGYDRMYQEIKIVSPAQEGIQQDDSFHQHGDQLYNGGYGLTYANDVGRFIAFAWGTRYQVPSNRMTIFSSYLLDGEQWMVRGDIIDYSVVGRVITRQGMVVAPNDWTIGPISPEGPAYSLPNVVAMLAEEPIPRQREFQSFSARLQGQENAPAFIGNKQFWCSDFMAHRRRRFYTSVKMLSNRMLNGEQVNGEGRKSHHLSDGVNFLYLSGNEYKGIFPVLDWTKLPGTTAIQGTLETGEKNPMGVRGKTTFDGGVSDGTYGMAAMDLSRGNLTAEKAWFFFDHSYLCLGAGITLSGEAKYDVATDVNQSLLIGKVFTNQSKTPVPDGTQFNRAGRNFWVYHDHVGYVLSANRSVHLSVGPQTGRWSDIGSGSNQLVTLPVFNLWIDHGYSPHNATYQYTVLPEASRAEISKRAKKPVIHVLSNNETIQAAWNNHLRIAMIAFRQPGSLATPIGRVAADHSCLLLIRKVGGNWRITASNPENQPLTLRVKIASREVTMDLPGGNFAGSSVTVPWSPASHGIQ